MKSGRETINGGGRPGRALAAAPAAATGARAGLSGSDRRALAQRRRQARAGLSGGDCALDKASRARPRR